MTFTQKDDERSILMSMTGFRLIFALDHILHMVNFATKAVQTLGETETVTEETKKWDKVILYLINC